MTSRYVVGDPVILTNTFTVSGTATDPTTITLEVTDPAGTTDTYSYGASELTKSATGVYTKTITADQRGTWTYVWTGTGTAADVEDGTFEVYPVATVDDLDVLTFGEALDALQLSQDGDDGYYDRVRQMTTAVSRRIDKLCGPVVIRTITDEAHDGGHGYIRPRHTPVSSVTSLTEYDGTTATTLTAETNATKPDDGYIVDDRGGHYQYLLRRSGNADGTFTPGRRNVVLTYEAGRAVDTEAVDERFKTAASACLRAMWHREMGAWARGGNPFGDVAGGNREGFFNPLDPVIKMYLPDDLRPRVVR